jgi:hypothetical protein
MQCLHQMFLFFVLFEISLQFFVKWGKCSPVKFANFGGKITIFEPKVVILPRVYKYIQNLWTSQGNIFFILQHLATNICSFTHSETLFPAVVSDFVIFALIKISSVGKYSWNHPLGKSETSSLNFYLSHFLNNHKGQYSEFIDIVFTVLSKIYTQGERKSIHIHLITKWDILFCILTASSNFTTS